MSTILEQCELRNYIAEEDIAPELAAEEIESLTLAERQVMGAGAIELFGTLGRRIDLLPLLRMRRGRRRRFAPTWAIVNPFYPISEFNGADMCASHSVGRRIGTGIAAVLFLAVEKLFDSDYRYTFVPQSFPVLPVAAREILNKLKRAPELTEWFGVLYKPDSWSETRIDSPADPAIVVQWKNNTNYHCLAVWGEDRGQIQEFIN